MRDTPQIGHPIFQPSTQMAGVWNAAVVRPGRAVFFEIQSLTHPRLDPTRRGSGALLTVWRTARAGGRRTIARSYHPDIVAAAAAARLDAAPAPETTAMLRGQA